MSTGARLGAFVAGLALLFGAAALAGGAVGPTPTRDQEDSMSSAHGHTAEAESHPVRGLAVAEAGLRVLVDTPELRRDAAERLTFRIVDAHGATVRDFDVAHEKRMHLIVVRRDLSGFQHLHPVQRADGAWTADVRLPEAGSYRLFADFTRHGEPLTLASDLRVDGSADLRDLPEAAAVAHTDGYEVRMDEDLRFTITRDGAPVSVEPYLGAGGHLVALREGDLAFLHVHPTGEGTAFEATFPTPGRYRLFLQFRHAGSVHTAAFTKVVDP